MFPSCMRIVTQSLVSDSLELSSLPTFALILCPAWRAGFLQADTKIPTLHQRPSMRFSSPEQAKCTAADVMSVPRQVAVDM